MEEIETTEYPLTNEEIMEVALCVFNNLKSEIKAYPGGFDLRLALCHDVKFLKLLSNFLMDLKKNRREKGKRVERARLVMEQMEKSLSKGV